MTSGNLVLTLNSHDLAKVQSQHNSTPRDDFDGLTPLQMYELVHTKIEESTYIKWQSQISDEVLDQIPMFRLLEAFLKIIERGKHIKLTPLGAIQKAVLVELYGLGWIQEGMIEKDIVKLTREQDSISITTLVAVSKIANFTRKDNNKLVLTTKSTKMFAQNNRQGMFKDFFITFISKYNLGYTDGYNIMNFGQTGWRFNIHLLLKYGRIERDSDFYAHKYIAAFPIELNRFGGQIKSATSCYELRIFERCLVWFNLVAHEKSSYLNPGIVAATPLLSKNFSLDNQLVVKQ